jgi:hypothetical protein
MWFLAIQSEKKSDYEYINDREEEDPALALRFWGPGHAHQLCVPLRTKAGTSSK